MFLTETAKSYFQAAGQWRIKLTNGAARDVSIWGLGAVEYVYVNNLSIFLSGTPPPRSLTYKRKELM